MPRLRNLKAIRESRYLSQCELAARSGVSRPPVDRLENQQVEARFSTTRKPAEALGVEPGELVGKEGHG